MRYYVGIDPGSKGAVAVLDESGYPIYLQDVDKDIATYWDIYCDTCHQDDNDIQSVVVEDVCGRPGQSCSANTTFMKLAGYAEFLGWMMNTDEYVKVKPQIWKKHFGLILHGATKADKKRASVELARKLFPSVEDELLISKDGRSEALLIARYLYDIQHAKEL